MSLIITKKCCCVGVCCTMDTSNAFPDCVDLCSSPTTVDECSAISYAANGNTTLYAMEGGHCNYDGDPSPIENQCKGLCCTFYEATGCFISCSPNSTMCECYTDSLAPGVTGRWTHGADLTCLDDQCPSQCLDACSAQQVLISKLTLTYYDLYDCCSNCSRTWVYENKEASLIYVNPDGSDCVGWEGWIDYLISLYTYDYFSLQNYCTAPNDVCPGPLFSSVRNVSTLERGDVIQRSVCVVNPTPIIYYTGYATGVCTNASANLCPPNFQCGNSGPNFNTPLYFYTIPEGNCDCPPGDVKPIGSCCGGSSTC